MESKGVSREHKYRTCSASKSHEAIAARTGPCVARPDRVRDPMKREILVARGGDSSRGRPIMRMGLASISGSHSWSSGRDSASPSSSGSFGGSCTTTAPRSSSLLIADQPPRRVKAVHDWLLARPAQCRVLPPGLQPKGQPGRVPKPRRQEHCPRPAAAARPRPEWRDHSALGDFIDGARRIAFVRLIPSRDFSPAVFLRRSPHIILRPNVVRI